MRSAVSRYFLWVVLPCVAALLCTQILIKRGTEDRRLELSARLGSLTTALFRHEMGEASADLARRAPVLLAPDSTSPVIQAVLGGDTVAALGVLDGELVLSVALAEEAPAEDQGMARAGALPVRIRAITEPFPASSVALLRGRTGFGSALYLRGDRVLGEPGDFGPERLPPETTIPAGQAFATTPSTMGTAVLLPLGPVPSGSSAIHLLVAPSPDTPTLSSPGKGALLLLLGLVLGLGVLARSWSGRASGVRPPARMALLAVTGLPLLGLWIGLWFCHSGARDGLREFRQGEMVRALALLKDSGAELGPGEVAGPTGYGVTLITEGVEVESTLPAGELRTLVTELPPPPSTSPTTGTLAGQDGPVFYASMGDPSGRTLILTAPRNEEGLRTLWLLLAGLGGLASILALGFPISASRLPGDRGGTPPRESGEPSP